MKLSIPAFSFLFASSAALAALEPLGMGEARDRAALLRGTEAYRLENLRDWGDVLALVPGHAPELDDPALSAATREFGPVVVPLAKLPFDSGVAQAEGAPWSSWWFPKVDRDLFEDGYGTSPLEKYDYVRAALTGKPSKAAAFEKGAYDADRPRWEGLCDAWAIAATLYPEPKARVLKLPNGATVSFSVSDLKALLLESVSAVPASALRAYGQRFTGGADGWIFPDLFPQELLRYAQKQLFERRRMFVMDHDPGVEVWSEPVFKAQYRLAAVAGRSDAVSGKLWLSSAGSWPEKNDKDRAGIREVAREYDFVLYGKPDGAGNLVVDGGEWVKGELVDSRRDHPDFVYHVADPAAFTRSSRNPEIDPQILDRILGR